MLKTDVIRDLYPDDLVVQGICDWVDEQRAGLELLDQVFGRIGSSPTGWGVVNFNLDMRHDDVPRMTIELLHRSHAMRGAIMTIGKTK